MQLRTLSFFLLAGLSTALQAQVAVVVNPKAGVDSLSNEQVAAFFLGKASSLPGGLSQALDLPEAHAARDHFYAKGAGKSASQVKATWARLAFSGKATPPKELGNAAEVKKFVGSHADAVGYIEKSAVDGSVKVVLTIE